MATSSLPIYRRPASEALDRVLKRPRSPGASRSCVAASDEEAALARRVSAVSLCLLPEELDDEPFPTIAWDSDDCISDCDDHSTAEPVAKKAKCSHPPHGLLRSFGISSLTKLEMGACENTPRQDEGRKATIKRKNLPSTPYLLVG